MCPAAAGDADARAATCRRASCTACSCTSTAAASCAATWTRTTRSAGGWREAPAASCWQWTTGSRPSTPSPRGADDALAVTAWAERGADGPRRGRRRQLGRQPGRRGDAAGRDRGGPAIAAQLLLYPVTDATMASPSLDELAEGRMLTRSSLAWMYDQYLPPGRDRSDPLGLPAAGGKPGRAAGRRDRHRRKRPAARRRRPATRSGWRRRASRPSTWPIGGTIHSFMLLRRRPRASAWRHAPRRAPRCRDAVANGTKFGLK